MLGWRKCWWRGRSGRIRIRRTASPPPAVSAHHRCDTVRGYQGIPVTEPGAYAADAGVETSHLYSVKWHGKLGPIFRDHDLGAVFISCPKMCESLLCGRERFPKLFVPPAWSLHADRFGRKRGLLFMDGQEWWQARRILNPLMQKDTAFSRMEAILEDGIEDLIHTWRLGSRLDINVYMYRLVVNALADIFLGSTKLPGGLSHDELADKLIHDIKGIFESTASLMIVDVVEAANRNDAAWQKFCDHLDSIMSIFRQMIRDCPRDHNSLAGQLISGGMREEEVENFISDLLLGGTDTTAINSSWVLHCLASQPHIQAVLRKEVEEVCGNQRTTSSSLNELHLTRGFVKEVMRVYPVVPFLTRILSKPLELGGHSLPAGTFVVVSSFVMGRNPDIFPDPERLIPERWSRNKKDYNDRHQRALSCLPFGHGVRMCIGRRISVNQTLLLVARILQEFNISTSTEQVTYVTRMIGVPTIPLHIDLKPIYADSAVRASDNSTIFTNI